MLHVNIKTTHATIRLNDWGGLARTQANTLSQAPSNMSERRVNVTIRAQENCLQQQHKYNADVYSKLYETTSKDNSS